MACAAAATFLLVVLGVVMPGQELSAHQKITHVTGPIQHIVFMIKENRSFDSYFGSYPGVNGATTGKIKVNGVVSTIPLNPLVDKEPDYPHGPSQAKNDYDNGAMDNFNNGENSANTNCSSAPYNCYVTGVRSTIPNYWSYADHFVIDDNTFTSERGPSFPNHLYTVSGGSGPDIPHSAVRNPSGHPWDCTAPTSVTVQLQNGSTSPPCFTYQTLADDMTQAGVSWKYYGPAETESGNIWTSLRAFKQDLNSPNIVGWQQFATDAASGNLPAFSWVVYPDNVSEHPSASSCAGENQSVHDINAVMNSNVWSSTAIFLTWDDYGGYYDHVAPSNVDALGYGFRAPFLVISPYAYAGDNTNHHISHDPLEFASVLQFAEQQYNLPSLGKRDVSAGSLNGLFDFSTVHNNPLILTPRTCPANAVKVTGFDD